MNGHTATTRELFDGAIKTRIPSNFLDVRCFLQKYMADVSDFRDVPDNQEIFVSTKDESSIMIDILEYVDAQDPAAAEFHFDALATDNEVDVDDDDDSRVFKTSEIPSTEHSLLPYVGRLITLMAVMCPVGHW